MLEITDGAGRHIETIENPLEAERSKEYLLQFFSYAHLPENLRAVSQPFCELAFQIVDTIPRNQERTVSLRKLLEAKDCAVRALIFKNQ